MRKTYLGGLITERAKKQGPVTIAMMGAGWYGSGTLHEITQWPDMETRVIFEVDVNKATRLLEETGVAKEDIVIVEDLQEMKEAFDNNKYIVTKNIDFIEGLKGIDIFFDATGNILVGAKAAMACIKKKLHFITASAELDATIGFTLCERAKEAGIIYSNVDGDQPGCLSRLHDEVRMMGLIPVAALNGKGFLDFHQNPDGVMKYCKGGLQPEKITSFADGTKQGLELTVVANAFNFPPDIRGMHGISTNKETLTDDIMQAVSQREGFVDFFFGKDKGLGMTVSIIAKCSEEHIKRDLRYLSMGDGPYYLFFRDYHLCYLETVRGFAEAILLNKPVIQPQGLTADVLTVAKKDLKKGERLGCIGGFNYYGLIDRYQTIIKEDLLPVGLAEYAVLKEKVAADTPITRAMVDFPEDNIVLQIRREQDEAFKLKYLT